jgi:hypothetical protein
MIPTIQNGWLVTATIRINLANVVRYAAVPDQPAIEVEISTGRIFTIPCPPTAEVQAAYNAAMATLTAAEASWIAAGADPATKPALPQFPDRTGTAQTLIAALDAHYAI